MRYGGRWGVCEVILFFKSFFSIPFPYKIFLLDQTHHLLSPHPYPSAKPPHNQHQTPFPSLHPLQKDGKDWGKKMDFVCVFGSYQTKRELYNRHYWTDLYRRYLVEIVSWTALLSPFFFSFFFWRTGIGVAFLVENLFLPNPLSPSSCSASLLSLSKF